MRIEHVAMYVSHLEEARDFFVKYLGAKSNDGYRNPGQVSGRIFSPLMMAPGWNS